MDPVKVIALHIIQFFYVNCTVFFTFLLGTGQYLTRYLCVAQIMIVVFQRNWNHDHVIRGFFSIFWIWSSSIVALLGSRIYLEGTLTSVVKMEQFGWTFWKIGEAQPLLWRQCCFPFLFVLLHLMIIRMLLLHRTSELVVSYYRSIFSAPIYLTSPFKCWLIVKLTYVC
jgi:hypothetical protein